MKRIVTFVVPLAPTDSPQPGEEGQSAGAASEQAGEPSFEQAAALPGAMKVEVVVSDAQANRIINSLLEHGSNVAPVNGDVHHEGHEGDWVESLVRRELRSAEPDAHDLLDRIVKRVERQLITKVYSDCDHVKSRAAARLGINRNTLLKKLREFGECTDEAE